MVSRTHGLTIVASLLSVIFWISTSGPVPVVASVPATLSSRSVFSVKEQLRYDISWIGIPVGEATLASEGFENSEEGGLLHFVSTVRSNHVLRVLYPVKTRIESFVEAERFLPVRYVMTGRQGYRMRNRTLLFDQAQHAVELVSSGEHRTYETVEAVQDPLSALYFYRSNATMREGEIFRVPVHDRKRPKEIVVTAGPVETIRTDAGLFDVVRLNVEQTGKGLFLHDGDLTVWITTDERRLPVRMEGHVAIGTVVAELTHVLRGSAESSAALGQELSVAE